MRNPVWTTIVISIKFYSKPKNPDLAVHKELIIEQLNLGEICFRIFYSSWKMEFLKYTYCFIFSPKKLQEKSNSSSWEKCQYEWIWYPRQTQIQVWEDFGSKTVTQDFFLISQGTTLNIIKNILFRTFPLVRPSLMNWEWPCFCLYIHFIMAYNQYWGWPWTYTTCYESWLN